jgi:CubicO group peptidase (beta-lactamase class C family)
MGYGLNNPTVSELYGNCFKGKTMAFWGGSGGSIVFNDLDARMTVAFVMNKHIEGSFDQRGVDILQAAYASLAGDKAKAAKS